MHGQPSIFRFVRLLLQPFGLDTATTGFRCWTSTGAPWATATRLHDGFALALGRREVVVSRR